jgi:hypothetical protein
LASLSHLREEAVCTRVTLRKVLLRRERQAERIDDDAGAVRRHGSQKSRYHLPKLVQRDPAMRCGDAALRLQVSRLCV